MWLALGVALAVLALGLAALTWYGAEQLTRRRVPDAAASPADYGLPFEAVSFAARDGTKLGGYWIAPPGGEARTAIVLCHGHQGSLDPDIQYAPWLREAGHGVLLFDFRGHGRSEGEAVSMGYHERSDLLGAVDWLTQRGVRRVGVLGFSLGGAVAIAAAPDHPAIAAVVADGAFAQLRTAVTGGLRERYSFGPLLRPLTWAIIQVAGWRVGGDLRHAEPLRAVGRLAPRALLLIHGARDPYVPMDSVRALYRAARAPKALWVAPEAGHREVDRYRPQEYRRRVLDFFARYLG